MIVALVIMAIAPSYARDEVTRDANAASRTSKKHLEDSFPQDTYKPYKVDKHTFWRG